VLVPTRRFVRRIVCAQVRTIRGPAAAAGMQVKGLQMSKRSISGKRTQPTGKSRQVAAEGGSSKGHEALRLLSLPQTRPSPAAIRETIESVVVPLCWRSCFAPSRPRPS